MREPRGADVRCSRTQNRRSPQRGHCTIQTAISRTFDANVIGVEGNALALDQTAFFPSGGGQLADRGALLWNGSSLSLTGLSKPNDVVWHAVDAAAGALPSVGDTVTRQLDWDFRYRMMRTHTALHVLCGADLQRTSARR